MNNSEDPPVPFKVHLLEAIYQVKKCDLIYGQFLTLYFLRPGARSTIRTTSAFAGFSDSEMLEIKDKAFARVRAELTIIARNLK